ncbi:MAG: hypothetical protein KJ904_12100 [Alphaproteobacteria bacterium]|nr:hypothetical protein [Alphaproteobacteria bacterium]MBU0797090.1 hypothetical protein [Alphaproteobacteria bacterium]MBU0887897.1 hypothetical protein [Alphaproteobacteria bacterium]MBU1814880.1 hypothetical protein [Alphaproteobacteria bacterium]MBU2090614.1 hypothetical protein [Alphaproteobacteria bacterium]
MEKSGFYKTVPNITDAKAGSAKNAEQKGGFLESYSRQKLDPGDPAVFRDRILEFVRNNKLVAEALIAGNIQMLGFSEVRKMFGERWPAIKDKVQLLAETTIRKYVTPVDVFLVIDEEQIVILFGRSTHAEATEKSERIAREISEKLSGVSGIEEGLVTCRALVLEIPGENAAEMLATPEALSGTVAAVQRSAEQAEKDSFQQMEAELRIAYWPMVNIRKKLISAYSASVVLPLWKTSGQERDKRTGVFECELDGFTLAHAGQAMLRAGHSRRALLLVPVHFDTLAIKPFRTQFIAACQLLPRISSKRLLLEIVDLPDGVPQGRLHTMFSYVAPFFAGFVGRQDMAFRNPQRFTGLKMIALSTDGSHVGTPNREDVVQMQGFAAAAGKARMRSVFYGASTFEAATAAKRTHFDYIQGAAVAPAVSEPGRVFVLK